MREPVRRMASRRERYRAGKALREKVPRSNHAAWSPPGNRPNPVDTLEESDRGRLPKLLPLKYGRMSLSPLAYLRGSDSVMALDLSGTPRTGLRVQLGGDAPLSNFGIFGTPERGVVFDLNDFDETLPGPWEWDIKRLVTSLVVAGRSNGFSSAENRSAVLHAARSYRQEMDRFGSMRYLDVWYSHLDPESVAHQVARQGRREIDRYARKAWRRKSFHAQPKMVHRIGRGYRIRDAPPLIVHYSSEEAAETTHALFERYLGTLPEERRMLLERYQPVDVVQKVVGVGSVGTVCSVMLLVGDRDTDDPLFLQVKQALTSALEPYAGASQYSNHAQRVVVGQHLIQEASDVFLGWSSLRSQDFYVRQLRDLKFAADPGTMDPRVLTGHGELCASALARAHARTGDPAGISGYLGTKDTFDQALAAFAGAYAAQTERDYAELKRAIKKGGIRAEPEI